MKLTKKLFIAIMTMALLVVTFSASTFAWFTLGQVSEIDEIQVKVKTGAGMEVSLDGKDWKNNISLPSKLFTNLEFVDLTSSDGLNIYQMNKVSDQPVAALKEAVMDGSNVTAKAQYLEFVLYVRVTKDEDGNKDLDTVRLKSVSGTDASITGDNGATAAGAGQWLSDASLGTTSGDTFTATSYTNTLGATKGTIEANKYYNFDALNAVKISFASKTDTDHAKFIYGYENANSWGTTGNKNAGLAKDFADAKDFSLTNAVDYSLVDGLTVVTYGLDTNPAQTVNGTNLIKYSQTSGTGISTAKADVLVAGDFDQFSALAITAGEGTTAPVGDDTHYAYAKLTIRIWLEGWDADCINAILEKSTELAFELEAYKHN